MSEVVALAVHKCNQLTATDGSNPSGNPSSYLRVSSKVVLAPRTQPEKSFQKDHRVVRPARKWLVL